MSAGKAAGERCATDFNEERVDALFAEVNQTHLPGAAVGIAIDGVPVYRKGFGLASLELPMVLTPSTRMRIGSTTKHFTALLYMLLCEEGLASPDDPLKKYLPELHAVTHAVTARQLMTNTNGLRDACDLRFQFSGTTGVLTTRDDLVALYRELDDGNAAPGTRWIYNNGGWVLLTALIERISGRSFEEAMIERIFRPLGMHDSLVRSWDTDFVANSATPHSLNRAGRLERLYWNQDFAGAGTVVSTIDDMLRWAANLSRHRLGSKETWSAMTAAHRLADGVSTSYGFGLFDTHYRGVGVIHHPGGYTGAGSQMIKVPAAGLDVVVLSNTDALNCTRLAYHIIDAVLPNLEPLARVSRPPVTGIFSSVATGRIVELFEREGQQIVAVDGCLDFPYEWTDRRSLTPCADSAHFKLAVGLLGDEAEPRAICLTEFGRPDELARVQPSPSASPAEIEGRYRSLASGTELTVFQSAGELRLCSRGRFGTAESTLESVTPGVWRARTTGLVAPRAAMLTLHPNGLTFSNFTTRALPFQRLAG